MPTQQQLYLSVSCPHQDWLSPELKNCDFFVRRSHVNPSEAHVPEVETGEENPHGSLTQALIRASVLIKGYRAGGAVVHKDIGYGVHLVTVPGEAPFYIFPEIIDRTATPGQSRATTRPLPTAPQDEYMTQTVRVEKRALKVLKALAERNEQPVSELLETIIAAAIDGENAFDPATMRSITQLKSLYGLCSPDTEADA